ncbi:hypothetical protein RN001_014536 [Aquatica leii]|uniref:Uncharacterized protein n=1 Tax=Aquatica leii TaxID=1421715 RepID=A0AAN7SBH5_9COLE|nr:hypothetical protein RN001_014536 [Aquatica leii]
MESSNQNAKYTDFNQRHSLEDYYPMTKNKLGKVYVFNQISSYIGGGQPRIGHIKDGKDIEETFQNLKFDVIKYEDLTYKDILEKLSNIAKMDYSEYGCLIFFVLTHGKGSKIFALDVAYYPDVYWKTLDENVTLLDKPKLIFLQSPHDEADYARAIPPRSVPTSYSIPEIPDVLFMYSCFNMFISWRSHVTGSSFIQCICKEIKQHAENTDILTILTFINRSMSLDFTKSLPAADGRRKMCTIVNTLNKVLYFGCKNK